MKKVTDNTGSAVSGATVTPYAVMRNGCNYLARGGF